MDREERSGQSAYSFPFTPYPSQLSLMNEIYTCLKDGQVGCFESPTGTGKSLSTICASLTWLFEEEARILERARSGTPKEEIGAPNDQAPSSDNWLSEYISQYEKKKAQESTTDDSYLLDSLDAYNELLKRIKESDLSAKKRVKALEQARLLLIKSHMDARSAGTGVEGGDGATKIDDDDCLIHFTEANERGLDDIDDDDGADLNDESKLIEKLQLPKIIFCSRTHSQLTQFMQEIRKTSFGSTVRCVTLGSRRTLCINPSVTSLASDAAMNEKCLELLQPKSQAVKSATADANKKQRVRKEDSSSKGCSFKQRTLEQQLSLQYLSQIHDIEDMVTRGKDQAVCPYYASKEAVQYAHVICIPYTVLLHPDVRATFHLSLTNNVVIIDEAHNLVEAISHSHSAEVCVAQLTGAFEAIQAYLQRYQTRLHNRSLYFLTLLSAIVKKLFFFVQRQLPAMMVAQSAATAVGDSHSSSSSSSSAASASAASAAATSTKTLVMTVNDLLVRAGMDHVNLFALRRFLVDAQLVPRIASFRLRNPPAAPPPPPPSSSTAHANSTAAPTAHYHSCKADLQAVVALLTCLTYHDDDGRVFVSMPTAPATTSTATSTTGPTSASGVCLKYQLLSTANRFRDIVTQARALVLLGGTMQPFHYFTSTILRDVANTPRLRLFACGHIIPRKQLLPLMVAKHRGVTLDFTHERRLHRDVTTALGDVLLQIFAAVPRGVVVFFPSYQYVEALVRQWQQPGDTTWIRLNAVKPIYVERRPPPSTATGHSHSDNPSGGSQNIWDSYCREVQQARGGTRGACLFSVLGGKLSEGINFSDDLARAVVVVGMPFPDTRDAVLQEKMRLYNALSVTSTASAATAAATASSSTGAAAAAAATSSVLPTLPELLCMRTVNQAIGRAIRHHRDFASVILIDHRYTQPRVMQQLPAWIRQSFAPTVTIAAMNDDWARSLPEFFVSNYAAWRDT